MLKKISMRTLTSAAGRKAAILTVIIAVAFLSACSGKKVVIGTNDEVRYSGTATKQEAEALGAQSFRLLPGSRRRRDPVQRGRRHCDFVRSERWLLDRPEERGRLRAARPRGRAHGRRCSD